MSRDFGIGPAVTYARAFREAAAEPCKCDYCALMRGSQWTVEQLEGFEGARRDRVMAGVDMPGRIVDDVRPDQRGG